MFVRGRAPERRKPGLALDLMSQERSHPVRAAAMLGAVNPWHCQAATADL